MRYRNFKDTAISEIGLGTWQLGSADWGTVKKKMRLLSCRPL
jgi:aryl-alcohol dehydrogenase-like predicted oxidoreductase